MRTPSLPRRVASRRAATMLAGTAAVLAAALLAAGCVAGPAGTATRTDSPVVPAASSVVPTASPVGSGASAAPAGTTARTPSPPATQPPTTTHGGTNGQPTPAVVPPTPAPTFAPTAPPTPRPTRPPTPAPTVAPAAVGTVTGLAHAGPVCPVAQLPPDPACADRPVGGVAITVTDAAGATVTTVTTDADGRFVVTLPPGVYTLVPRPREGLMRTPGPETVTVSAGTTVTVDFAYDTGIR